MRRRWQAIAIATGDSNIAAAEQAVAAFYEACGVAPPEQIVWCDSPHQLARMGIEHAHGALPHPSEHLFAQGDHPIARDWRASSKIWIPPLREKKAWSNIAMRLNPDLTPAQWQRLNRLLFTYHTVPGIPDHGWDEDLPSDFLQAAYIFDFRRTVAGSPLSSYTQAAVALARETAGWWIAGRTTALLCRRPEIFECDSDGELHCEDGPAARWRDGTTIYARHGERYPASAIEDPAAMTVETVLTERDHGVRRELVARYPLERLLAEANAAGTITVLDENEAYGRVLTITPPPEAAYEKAIRTYGIEWVKLRIYLPSPAARKRCRRLAAVHIDDFGRWELGKHVFIYLDAELPGRASVLARLRLWRLARWRI